MASLKDLENLLPALSPGERAQVLKWIVARFYSNENIALQVVQELRR